MQLAPPRAYVNWDVPVNAAGYNINNCHAEDDYHVYLPWLADYLYETEIPVPDSQRPLLESYRDMDVDAAIFWLSDDWGSYCWNTLGIIERAIETGTTYRQYQRREQREWRSLDTQFQETISKENFFITEADYHRIEVEYAGSRNVPEFITHADIPYRAVLAALLKKVPDREQRVRILDRFFYNFSESSSK